MKYNLKNRPKLPPFYPTGIGKDKETDRKMFEDLSACYEWFKNFEKELREQLSQFEQEDHTDWQQYPIGVTEGWISKIKEILGETSP